VPAGEAGEAAGVQPGGAADVDDTAERESRRHPLDVVKFVQDGLPVLRIAPPVLSK
jgi:hypothetical protein